MVLVEVLIHASALMVSVAYFSGLAPADTVAQALVYISSTYLAVSYTASFVNSFYPLTLSHGAANNGTVFSPVEPAFVAEAVPTIRAPEPSAAVDDSAKEQYEMDAAFIRDGWTTHVSKGGEYIHWRQAGNPTPPSLRRNVEADDDRSIFQSARTYSQEHHRQSPYLRPSLKATLIVVRGSDHLPCACAHHFAGRRRRLRCRERARGSGLVLPVYLCGRRVFQNRSAGSSSPPSQAAHHDHAARE